MSGKVSKLLRRKAESQTIGMPKSKTKAIYKQLKKEYKPYPFSATPTA